MAKMKTNEALKEIKEIREKLKDYKDYKSYRNYLNKISKKRHEEVGQKQSNLEQKHNRYAPRKRLQGDYLWFQDREGFEMWFKQEKEELKQKAQELADENKFEGGCGKRTKIGVRHPLIGYKCCVCGNIENLCPTCQDKKEIQEINKEIQES